MDNEEFKIRIAERIIHIKPLYDCIYEFCKDYVVGNDEDADITVSVSYDDIEEEKRRENSRDNTKRIPKDYPDSYIELLAAYRKIAEELPRFDTFLVHGSAISIDGSGVIFMADSGVGKSTHSRHWQELFSERVCMVNDDKPLIMIKDGFPYVCGSPWSGKSGKNSDICVPVKAILRVKRALYDKTQEMTSAEKWALLTEQTYKSTNPKNVLKTLELQNKLIDTVKFGVIECTDSQNAAQVSCDFVMKDDEEQ